MSLPNREALIQQIAADATEWRRELHRHPGTMYEEIFASDFIAAKLSEWGIPHERGIAKTGIAASIAGRQTTSGRSIAFRADIDALDLIEQSGQPWASTVPGKMHGCGHDGHTATLLALAYYLQQTRNFDGTVVLIFQPAEEGGRGSFKMLEEGLLDRFPFDEVYGYHNWPFIPRGSFAIRPGPMMAAVDIFEINFQGRGGHAGMPHGSVDVLPAAAQLVLGFQTLVSRETDPVAAAVLSVTRLHAGGAADNVITGTARIGGTVRTFNAQVRDHIEARMKAMTDAIATAYNATVTFEYTRLMDATVNDPEHTEFAIAAAETIAGPDNVHTKMEPVMGGEDFGGFLLARPGAFIAIGQGEEPGSPHSQSVHHPKYDFNDAILPIATGYFAELAERRLPID